MERERCEGVSEFEARSVDEEVRISVENQESREKRLPLPLVFLRIKRFIV